MASSEATLYYAEQSAEEFVMEEGAVLCQRDQDSQKMMKAKKYNNMRICNLYKIMLHVSSHTHEIFLSQLSN